MAIPSVNMLANLPGGAIPNVLDVLNTFAKNRADRRYSEAKAAYAPMSMQAQAASQMAYANLVNPQFIAKMMANPGFMGNLSESQKNTLKELAYNAGVRNQGTGNALLQGGMAAPEPSFTDKMKNAFHALTGQGQGQPQQQANPMNMMPGQGGMGQMSGQLGMGGQMQPPQAQGVTPQNPMLHRPKDGVTLEGEQWYNTKGEPVYEAEETTPDGSMKLELTKGIPPKKTYAEKTGEYLGTVKQGEEAGKFRAKALDDIGKAQLGLSNSGAVLDRMTEIVKNPIMQQMRDTIPFFQDKQLNWIAKTGTPEQQRLIGDFLSTAESFIASTVQGFSGKPLVREFDLAQRQKITPNDTMGVAEGKLRSAISLKQIAEQKNQIVSELLDKGYSEAEAVKQANKMVDVSAIERDTRNRLEDKITDEDIEHTAKETGMTREQVIQRLKAEGRYNG